MNVPLSPRQEAELEQGRGSDPAASAWVTASAGSGKTKEQTDRVLRRLLAPDTRPNAILCLTFTKAAAAEMATRLARDLGRWAVAPEAQLAAWLSTLLGRTPTQGDLDAARKLFCRVLELPGGMRISTIHAFCQSLLRAFPLEAGLSPQFGVVDDAEAAALLASAQEDVLSTLLGEATDPVRGGPPALCPLGWGGGGVSAMPTDHRQAPARPHAWRAFGGWPTCMPPPPPPFALPLACSARPF